MVQLDGSLERMLALSRTRLVFFLTVTAIATASLVSACTEDAASSSSEDAGADVRKRDSGNPGDEEEKQDEDNGGEPTKDSGTEPEQVDGPGEAGAECAFNRDCKLALRCECDESTGCACQPGERGTGKNGIDVCDSGDQCASALCVEGPDQGESICSDACNDDKDCTGKLPRCIPVFGIPEPICAREPPM